MDVGCGIASGCLVGNFAFAKCARAQEGHNVPATPPRPATQQAQVDVDVGTDSSKGSALTTGSGFVMTVQCKVCWMVGKKTSKEPHRLAMLPPPRHPLTSTHMSMIGLMSSQEGAQSGRELRLIHWICLSMHMVHMVTHYLHTHTYIYVYIYIYIYI